MNIICTLFAVLYLLVGPALRGETFTVTSTNNSGAGSLRQALADAALQPGADIIVFDPMLFNGAPVDTIILASEIVVDDVGGITVDASTIAGGVTITDPVTTPGGLNDRLFAITNGSTVIMHGLVFVDGGGVEFGSNGGAISNEGTLSLLNCSLSGFGSDHGGAIFNDGGMLALSHCTFANCYSGNGGALLNLGGSMTLSHCTLSGNVSTSQGGGAIDVLSGTVALTSCTLDGNSAVVAGAILARSGTLTLTHCTLTGNSSSDDGGAIYIDPGASVILTHCTVAGNHDGDAVGAIYVDGGTLMLANSIVAGTTGGGADIHNDGTLNRVGANLVQTLFNDPDAIVNGTGTISSAAPLLAPLRGYGGPTQTMPPLHGSPAIDAASVVAGLTADQRGAPLPGSARDIGSVELGQTIVDITTDENDGLENGGKSLREALTDPAPFGSELVHFAPALDSATLTLASEIIVSKLLTLVDASNLAGGVTISGNNMTRMLTVVFGSVVHLKNFTFTSGNGRGAEFFYDRNGGAILNAGGTMALQRCTLSGNSAEFSGGAIFSDGAMTLTHCTFSGNTVGMLGGAVYNDGRLTLTHCTLSENSATNGGAIASYYAVLTLAYCIVAGNTAAIGPDIENLGWPPIADGVNVIGNNHTVEGPFAEGPLVGTIDRRLDALLAPLGAYGGSTKTMALKPASPARNAAVGSTVTSDQRGFPIVGTPDLGAYETGTLTNFHAWAHETLPATATSEQYAAASDFDDDGRLNLLEYATHSDGAASDQTLIVIFTRNAAGTEATITFPTRFNTPDLFFGIDRSTTLGTWTNIFTYNGATNASTAASGVTASFTAIETALIDTFVASEPKVFYRLRVTQL